MPLTNLQKAVIGECARLMGLNGGLAYKGLMSDIVVRQRLRGLTTEQKENTKCMRAIMEKYGLSAASTGEVVQTAISKGDTRMRISVSTVIKPELNGLEFSVLEAAAKVLLPRGGYFAGHYSAMCEATGLDLKSVDNTITALKQKFNVPNLELAVVSAFASGILYPGTLFGKQLPFPQPLLAIMSSDSFRKASLYPATGVHRKRLTEAEKMVARELIKLLGINGGLYWGRQVLLSQSADSIGIPYHATRGTLESMNRRLGFSHLGLILYEASELLGVKVEVKIPPLCQTDFNDTEHLIMLQTAKAVIPSCGFYKGYKQTVIHKLHFSGNYIGEINHQLVEKTGTENLGQAVTYFIAHGLIPVSELKLDVQRTPALEAIVNAMSRLRI